MSLLNLIAAVRKAFPEPLREQAYADLMALDDRSLADIGLRRSDVVGRFLGAAHRIDTKPEASTGIQQRPGVGYFPPF
jgi:uncharacterized protein YjiS (DUF1127 family)